MDFRGKYPAAMEDFSHEGFFVPDTTKVGIIGGGWPGIAHARGYSQTPGFKVVAVADLIPDRRNKLMAESGAQRQYGEARELLLDKQIDAVSICLPTHLHAEVAIAALRSGKHVLCERPPAMNLTEARRMVVASEKAKKVLMYALQRRFGAAELASKQAIIKGYIGDVFHVRAAWTRTRGVPIGTGWFTHKEKSGGGAMLDLGLPMLDLAWQLLGQPRPLSIFACVQRKLIDQILPPGTESDVEDSGTALIKFDGGKTLELTASWAMNQPPNQNGVVCRVAGTSGALDIYTPGGAVLYRRFDAKGSAEQVALKPPRVFGHPAMMRHLRDCITGKTTATSAAEGVSLMEIMRGIYDSAEKGRSVQL